MGIVVAVCMLFALLLLAPWPPALAAWRHAWPRTCRGLSYVVLAAGLWNAFWHGLRYPGEFWGIAALVSGLLMIAAAVHLLRQAAATAPPPSTLFRGLLIAALTACFLVYAVTLIQLNLGYAIIGT